MAKVIIISAPSGAGKTTIVKNIMEKYPEFNLAFSVSATTRPKRPNEINGKDYYFLTVEEFKNKIRNNEFIEWQEVYKNQFYGTLKSEIDRLFKQGKNIIFDVDVKGALNLKKIFGDNALAIFIEPPSIDELERRLRLRSTETEEAIRKRLQKAQQEISYRDFFDVIIVNDDLNEAIAKTKKTIENFIFH